MFSLIKSVGSAGAGAQRGADVFLLVSVQYEDGCILVCDFIWYPEINLGVIPQEPSTLFIFIFLKLGT